MIARFQSVPSSNLWRATYIVCMVMVFSYIFFDVLDLDESDLPLKLNPAGRFVVVLEVSKEAKGAYLPDQSELKGHISLLFSARSGESVWYHRREDFRPSQLGSARARGYLIALPRASIENASPSA